MTVSMISILCFFVGIGLGFAFFAALKINSEIYISDGLSWSGLALHLGRFAIAGFIFWFIAGFGAMPLLSSFGGFLASRFFVMRFLRRKEE